MRRLVLAVLPIVLVVLAGTYYERTRDREWLAYQYQMVQWHTTCDGSVGQPVNRRTDKAKNCARTMMILAQWAERKGWRGR